MSPRSIVQEVFDALAHEARFTKRSGTWYRRQAETIAVLDLQRSQYAPRYYLNVALWLLPLGDAESPPEHKCHVRTRLGTLAGPELGDRVTALLDAEADLDDDERRAELRRILYTVLFPLLDACGTIDGLRSSDEGRLLRERSLVNRAALEILGESAFEPK